MKVFGNLKRFATRDTVRRFGPTVTTTLASMTDAELLEAAEALDELHALVEAEHVRRIQP